MSTTAKKSDKGKTGRRPAVKPGKITVDNDKIVHGSTLEPLIYDLSSPGQRGVALPDNGFGNASPEAVLPSELLRTDLPLPEVAEPTVIRHFVRLSRKNFSIDSNFYPLGSCTMKYNPRINEEMAGLPAFKNAHPMLDDDKSQGVLRVYAELRRWLLTLTGFDDLTLQPAAGAQGELVGMLVIHAYHRARGEKKRLRVLIPDSAHGTNPATCTLAGFTTTQIPSGPDGLIDIEALKANLGDDLAGIMLTNPNTLGLFEENILEVCRLVHESGGLVYCDGANMNAILGVARPGDMGIDVMHLNLHKTFSTPHGGGGPGAGPVLVKSHLTPFLPTPYLVDDDGRLHWETDRPQSIGRVHSHKGNYLILLRALTYIMNLGTDGARQVAENAVLKANYVRMGLRKVYHLPYDRTCMHEAVFSDKIQNKYGVKTLDIAKRLMDFGFHPMTVYFPLIVHGAIMIEPTETESMATLREFIKAMRQIAKEAKTTPEVVTSAPHTTEFKRLDEVRAAKELDLNVFFNSGFAFEKTAG